MKKKLLGLVFIIAVVFSAMNIISYAATDSYAVRLTPNKTSVKAGETIAITVRFEDIKIESGEKGIGSYEATLEYDKNIFEYVSMTSAQNWDGAIYNAETGKFASVRSDSMCTSESQDVVTINLKAKTSATIGESTVSVKNIACSNFEENVPSSDVSIKISIVDASTGDNNNAGSNDNAGDNNNAGSNDNAGDNNNAGSNDNAGNNNNAGSNDNAGDNNNAGSNDNAGDNNNAGSNDNAGDNNNAGSNANSGDNNNAGSNANSGDNNNAGSNQNQGNTDNGTNQNTNNKQDTATSNIPQTGESFIVVGVICLVLGLGIISYMKYREYKQI